MVRIIKFLFCAVWVFLIAGCSVMQPASNLEAGNSLRAPDGVREVKKTSDTLVYKDPTADYLKYEKFLLEPVVIYSGEDHDFGSIPENDRQMMADFVRDAFIEKMTGHNGYAIVEQPGPDVVRVKFTLIGMTRTTRSLQAITLLNPIGLGVNALQSASGAESLFVGNVTLAAEFYDSQSGKLISFFQAKRYPLPINVVNLIGEYDAAKAGVNDVMDAIRGGADANHRSQGKN